MVPYIFSSEKAENVVYVPKYTPLMTVEYQMTEADERDNRFVHRGVEVGSKRTRRSSERGCRAHTMHRVEKHKSRITV